MTKDNSKAARTRRFIEAEERRATSEARPVGQQIAILDKRLGEGVGATKERERLALRA